MRVLVAGATGSLGRHVLAVLQQRGHYTRALSRQQTHIGANEVIQADALNAASLSRIADGIDAVFSCLGQTVSGDMSILRPGYLAIDVPANLNLLREAIRAKVPRFVYVSVLNAKQFPQVRYLNAHAQVSLAVETSGLSFAILEPTGFYSAFAEKTRLKSYVGLST